MLLGFEGFFGLFLLFFGLSEVFNQVLVVPSDFFWLALDDVHLSFHFDDFIGRGFGFLVHLPTYSFVILNLLIVLNIHLL